MRRSLWIWLTAGACLALCGCDAAGRALRKRPLLGVGEGSADPTAVTGLEDARRPETDSADTELSGLSPASRLMVKACDNYIAVNPGTPKTPEVLTLKASVYYNSKLFGAGRNIYQSILGEHPDAPEAVDAVRMIAQSHYEEKDFDKAQKWYRKLQEMAGEGEGRTEAAARIAESVFRMAEMNEEKEDYEQAAAQYERVALEFPDAKIADVSLFNAGLAYEKQAEWSRAIFMYQRLLQRYRNSGLVSKAMFRTAKSHEKLMQWDNAAQMYLRHVTTHPHSELTPTSLYNAGFSFENAGKLHEAAATFEKLAMSFPESKDAPDVLFRAGELYGKLNDWENVTRVNKEFSHRYGSDMDRIVQAKCMIGVALYMQGKEIEAIDQLKDAVATCNSLQDPSSSNRFYAAKALFTVGEIHHKRLNGVKLTLPKTVYRKQLRNKSAFLDKTVDVYSKVLNYGISEWTTRAIYQIGQAYEDFALGVFRQQRPGGLSLDESLALEMGIAKAVAEYFVDRALSYHEHNVKLAIKEKLDNKHVINSRKKLTYLPFVAGKNFLSLVDIAIKAGKLQNLEGFALISHKLQMLQKIAPFQENAIDLFLKSLEMGSLYEQQDEFFQQASGLITRTSFTVAETYGDGAAIARSAPIPQDLNAYEQFVYKTKLLRQIQGYEDNALTNYMKAIKVADAYDIDDAYVTRSRERLAQLLFVRGRCYDLLCIASFTDPPYPADIDEVEKEEYRARFEEIALTFQEQAFETYRIVMEYADKGYAAGKYLNHAYTRLYQNYPEEYGVKKERIEEKFITSGPKWKCSPDSSANWMGMDYDDDEWLKVAKTTFPDSVGITGFPGQTPPPMWYKTDTGVPHEGSVFFRRKFYVTQAPHKAELSLAAAEHFQVFFNGDTLTTESLLPMPWHMASSWDLVGKLRQGKNILAVRVWGDGSAKGLLPHLRISVTAYDYLPQFPGTDAPVAIEQLSEDTYAFPFIKNFSPGPGRSAGNEPGEN